MGICLRLGQCSLRHLAITLLILSQSGELGAGWVSLATGMRWAMDGGELGRHWAINGREMGRHWAINGHEMGRHWAISGLELAQYFKY